MMEARPSLFSPSEKDVPATLCCMYCQSVDVLLQLGYLTTLFHMRASTFLVLLGVAPSLEKCGGDCCDGFS